MLNRFVAILLLVGALSAYACSKVPTTTNLQASCGEYYEHIYSRNDLSLLTPKMLYPGLLLDSILLSWHICNFHFIDNMEDPYFDIIDSDNLIDNVLEEAKKSNVIKGIE